MNRSKQNKVFYLFLLFALIGIPLLNYLTQKICQTSLSPDTMLFYSVTDLKDVATIYGTSGAYFYLFSRLTFDLAFPFVYMATLFQILNLLPFKTMVSVLKKFVVAVVLFDLLENFNVSVVLFTMPNTKDFWLYFALISSWSKWILLFYVMIMMISLDIYRRIKHVKSNPVK